jgi:chloramphenicol 3-O phosphotransferase
MSEGRLLLLNGVSSSGKSSIAKALQGMIEEPCIHLCIDDYLGAFQNDLWDKREIVQPAWPSIIAGFHAAAAAIARAGNLVIVDDVLEDEPPWVENLLELFADLEVIFIGVHCPLEELERRESERGDRKVGMARLQFEQVHTRAIYDIEVDTSVQSPEECAAIIADYVNSGQRPTAFEQLQESTRSSLGPGT